MFDASKPLEINRKVRAGERRYFIGGSDARIIMANDEAALLGLCRQKRGEAEPEDLSGNLLVQLGLVTEALNRSWYMRNTGQVVTAVQPRVRHPVIRFLAATLDGIVESSGAVFESNAPMVLLRRGGSAKVYRPGAALYVGDERADGGALDHHRRRQVGRTYHPG